MAQTKISKKSVVAEMKKLGYSKETAEELIAKHIDIYEVNADNKYSTARSIALSIDEEENQHRDDDDREFARGGEIAQTEKQWEKEVYDYLKKNYPNDTDEKLGEISDEEYNDVFFKMVDDLREKYPKGYTGKWEDESWANEMVEHYMSSGKFARGGKIKAGDLVKVKSYGWIMKVDSVDGKMYDLENSTYGIHVSGKVGNPGTYHESEIEKYQYAKGGMINGWKEFINWLNEKF